MNDKNNRISKCWKILKPQIGRRGAKVISGIAYGNQK
jgi:hypothetical protein